MKEMKNVVQIEEAFQVPKRKTEVKKVESDSAKKKHQQIHKVVKALNILGKDLLMYVFNVLFTRDEHSEDGKATLQNWFKNKGKTNSDYKSMFHDQMNDRDSIKDMSFKFYYVAITRIYGEKISPHHNLDKALKEIFSMRNKTEHFTIGSKLPTLQMIEKEFLIILKELQSYFVLDCEKKILEIKKNFVDLRKVNKNRLMNDVLLYSRTELDDQIRKTKEDSSSNPFYWTMKNCKDCDFSLDSVFTSPIIMAADEFNVACEHIFSPEDDRRKQANVILLCGEGGSGKTTLCHKILDEWLRPEGVQMFEKLSSYQLVVFSDIRSVSTNDLNGFLASLMPNTFRTYGQKYTRSVLNETKILFILDGFDEKDDNSTIMVKDLSEKLKQEFPECALLLTTRPFFHGQAERIFDSHEIKLLNLKGFNEESSIEFSKKVFVSSKSDRHEEFISFYKRKNCFLGELLKYPLNMALLIVLFLSRDGKSDSHSYDINSKTTLYFAIFNMLISKLCETREKSSSLPQLEHMFSRFCEIAPDYVFGDEFSLLIREKHTQLLQGNCRQTGVDYIEFMSAFTESRKLKSSPTFSFLHKSQLEYNCGIVVSDRLQSSRRDFDRIVDATDKRYLDVLPYIVGMLSRKHLDNHAEDLLHLSVPSSFGYLCGLVSEINEADRNMQHSSRNCERRFCQDVVSDRLDQHEWTLNDASIRPAFTLLKHCKRLRIEKLSITVSSGDGYASLYEASESVLSNFQRSHRLNGCKVQTSLKLNSQYDNQSINTVKILENFNTWSNIVNFEGWFTSESVLPILQHNYLKYLRLRFRTHHDFAMFSERCATSLGYLRKLQVTVSWLGQVTVTSSMKPLPSNPEIALLMQDIDGNNWRKALSNAQIIFKQQQNLDIVIVRPSIPVADVMEFVQKLQLFDTLYKVSVLHNSEDMEHRRKREVQQLAGVRFVLDWNNEAVISL